MGRAFPSSVSFLTFPLLNQDDENPGKDRNEIHPESQGMLRDIVDGFPSSIHSVRCSETSIHDHLCVQHDIQTENPQPSVQLQKISEFRRMEDLDQSRETQETESARQHSAQEKLISSLDTEAEERETEKDQTGASDPEREDGRIEMEGIGEE